MSRLSKFNTTVSSLQCSRFQYWVDVVQIHTDKNVYVYNTFQIE